MIVRVRRSRGSAGRAHVRHVARTASPPRQCASRAGARHRRTRRCSRITSSRTPPRSATGCLRALGRRVAREARAPRLRARRVARRRRARGDRRGRAGAARRARDRVARTHDLARAAARDLADRAERGDRRAHGRRCHQRFSRARCGGGRTGRAARADRGPAALRRRRRLARAPEHRRHRQRERRAAARQCDAPVRRLRHRARRRDDRWRGARARRPGSPTMWTARSRRAARRSRASWRDCSREPYFAAPPPKSTGRELFDRAYIARFIERCRAASPRATTEDIVATAVALHGAVDRAMRTAASSRAPIADVVISGGGARNPALVRALDRRARAAAGAACSTTVFFDGDAKEAVAFAFLGRLFLERRAAMSPRPPARAGRACSAS